MSLLSVIIPAYNEEESVQHVLPALRKVLGGSMGAGGGESGGQDSGGEVIDFEVIFVDDGSTDRTFEKITEICAEYKNARGYSFSRNFGKEAAIWAGLENACGDCCVVMDCDLQHPPDVLPEMHRLWKEGYEVVEGVKASRGKESFIHKLFSKAFYKLIVSLSGLDMRTSSDFKLLDKRVVQALLQLKERNSFFRGLSHWVGFRSVKIEYDVAPRLYGKTKWRYHQLFRYAMNNIVGFSTAPMQIVTFIGGLLVAGSIALAVQTLVRFILGHAMEGFTTVILLILFVGGGLMISLGIIGLYIAKIYDEVKGRPRFIISKSAGDEADRRESIRY